MSGAWRGLRSPDARAFNAPLYALSYLGKLLGAPCGIRTRGFRRDRPALWPLSQRSNRFHPVTGSGAAQSSRPICVSSISTSAVPEREHPVGCGASLHVTWPRVAHIPYRQHHVARPRSARAHPKWSGCNAARRAASADLQGDLGQYRDRPAQIFKDHPPLPMARSIDRWPAPMHRPVGARKQRGPDPCGIRASANREARVRVLRRCPLPDASDPHTARTSKSSPAGTDAQAFPVRQATSSLRRARTRPRPGMGRLVLMALPDVTMKRPERSCAQ